MTNIKVRAWDKTRKQMFTSPKWVEFSVNIKGELTAKNYDYVGDEQALEILQYTGLNDKNGIEIYEDYVLSATVVDNKYKQHDVIGKVIFNEFEYCLETNLHYWPVISWKCVESCEIIGNIYENPELVE